MPVAENIGCRAPAGRARPSAPRSGLEGEKACTQARAVTCGGIISGSTKQKIHAVLPRMLVCTVRMAASVPMATAITEDRTATCSELSAAVITRPLR